MTDDEIRELAIAMVAGWDLDSNGIADIARMQECWETLSLGFRDDWTRAARAAVAHLESIGWRRAA
jgi:hypothetical protein